MTMKPVQKNIILYNNGERCGLARILEMIKAGKPVLSDTAFIEAVSDPKNMSDVTRRTYEDITNRSATTRTLYAIVKDGGKLGESIEFSHEGTLKLIIEGAYQKYSGLAVHLNSNNFNYKVSEGGKNIVISDIPEKDIIAMERIPIDRAAYDYSDKYHDHRCVDTGSMTFDYYANTTKNIIFDYYSDKTKEATDKYLESLIGESKVFECLKDWTLLKKAEEGRFTLWKTSEGGKIVSNGWQELNRVVGLGTRGNPRITKEYVASNIFPPFAACEVLIESRQ